MPFPLQSSPRHLSGDVLNVFIALSKFLMSSPSTATLLRQLYDHILFNPPLWIRANIDVSWRSFHLPIDIILSIHAMIVCFNVCVCVCALGYLVFGVSKVSIIQSEAIMNSSRAHILRLIPKSALHFHHLLLGEVARSFRRPNASRYHYLTHSQCKALVTHLVGERLQRNAAQ